MATAAERARMSVEVRLRMAAVGGISPWPTMLAVFVHLDVVL